MQAKKRWLVMYICSVILFCINNVSLVNTMAINNDNQRDIKRLITEVEEVLKEEYPEAFRKDNEVKFNNAKFKEIGEGVLSDRDVVDIEKNSDMSLDEEKKEASSFYDVIHSMHPYGSVYNKRVKEVQEFVKTISGEKKYSSFQNAQDFIENFNDVYIQNTQKETDANWNYLTDMTKENGKKLSAIQTENMSWMQKQIKEARSFLKFLSENDFKDDKSLYRQLKLIPIGNAISNKESVNRKMNDLQSQMNEIYGTTKVDGTPLDELDKDLRSDDKTFEEKAEIWNKWRSAVGPRLKPLYTEYVSVANQAARSSGYKDLGEVWREMDFGYETDDLVKMTSQLYDEILPMYKQLHAYVRRKLMINYPEHFNNPRGLIPAHILGNMWAQQWDIFDIVAPFPNAAMSDITDQLKKQKYTAEKMFKTAESFFVSIGLDKMTDIFWQNSMITRPEDKEVECHASAEDFFRENDFRIKMCTSIDSNDFTTIHHEMGHIEYFMQYANQPAVFRTGANAAFHEAIGDTIALAVNTPKHAQAIGLHLQKRDTETKRKNTLPSTTSTSESDLNFLMDMALKKIAFLPFGFLIDQYRWDVFSGKTPMKNLNRAWWELRNNVQGISSPVPRTEQDFDAGAKYHVAANVPYIRYFFSHIAQFEFFQAMCTASGHKGPLHKCDFYKSKPAGELLKKMLSLGRSLPWQEAMQQMTGKNKFDTTALKAYFKPLMNHITKVNLANKEYIGWEV